LGFFLNGARYGPGLDPEKENPGDIWARMGGKEGMVGRWGMNRKGEHSQTDTLMIGLFTMS